MKWLIITIGLTALAVVGTFSITQGGAKEFSIQTPTFLNANKNGFSIGWVGDIVPATDSTYNASVLVNVSGYTQGPTLMMGNLEGTFAEEGRISKCTILSSNCHAFKSDSTFAYELKSSGFDFVSLVNNHSYDYGENGLTDTEKILDDVGIPYISPTKPETSLLIHGKKIGILGVSNTQPVSTITDYDFIKKEVSKLKSQNDIVILIFHGGSEGSDKTIVTGDYEYFGDENRGNVELVAKTAIDAGADIVLGSGPHVLRKIEYYKDRPIIYSAGNFVGGNGRLTTEGNLGISAIFNIFINDKNIFSHKIISVLLSSNGIPNIDPTEKAKSLIESLSK